MKGAAATAAVGIGISGKAAAETTVPPDADLADYVANHQGETIYVPDETYFETDTIVVGTGTNLIFQGTTIDPGTGLRIVIRGEGSNWLVGGDCTIIQQGKNMVRFQLYGSGQFGNTDGRITVDGYIDTSLVQGGSGGSAEVSTFLFDGGSGHVELINVTHPGVPPGSSANNKITWTDRPGDITVRGCDIRNVGSNGWYVKPMRGRLEMYDCYFKNINVGVARTGCNGGTLFDRCCVVYDSGLPYQDWSGGRSAGMVTPQDRNSTCGDIEVRNCDYVERDGIGTRFVRGNLADNSTIPDGGFDIYISDTQWTDYPNNRDTAWYLDYFLEGGNGGSPVDSQGPYPAGGGGGDDPPEDVKEDFEHDDIPGTYIFDTASFATTSTRSTAGTYSIQASASSDGGECILRDDMAVTAGNTYELEVYFTASTGEDLGILFGGQSSTTGWNDYTGYLGLFESDDGEIRIDHLENGTRQSMPATSMTWPTEEWLTVELDYRNTDSSTIMLTVFDADGNELGSVSLADTTYDSGTIGWFNYHASSSWFADSWFNADYTPPTQVAEDFSHNNVQGVYDIDTGSFDTSSTRSTSDSYSLQPSASSDGGEIVIRDDMKTTAGNTYQLDVYFTASSGEDLGFLFGAQGTTTGWSDYTGYMGLFESDDDEIRIDYLEGGSRVSMPSTATTWPTDEWLTVELDYRESDDSTITMTVFDASGAELGSVSLADTTYDDGTIGWFNYHASSSWFADSWFESDSGSEPTPVEPTVLEDAERADPLADYGGATDLFSVETTTVYEGSQAFVNDGGDFGSTVSTSGLPEYPARGEEIHYYFNNAADDNFVAFHLFAQSETDNPDSYSVGVSGQGAWRIWRHEGGAATQVASQDLPAAEQIDGWYRAEVWSDATTIYADLYDDASETLLASVQADDTTYSSGGIGFRSAGNGEVWDYAVRGPIEDAERATPLSAYEGATDLFGVETTTVYEGSQAFVNDGGDFGSIASTSGLREYPDRGEAFTYYFTNAADDNFVAFHLFAQSETDNPDSYSIGISGQGAWRIWRHEGGTATQIANQDLPAEEQIDGWYRAEVSSDDTTIYADLYDDETGELLASIQADDTTYTSGGIGFRSAGNGEIWDHVIR